MAFLGLNDGARGAGGGYKQGLGVGWRFEAGPGQMEIVSLRRSTGSHF
jgi:hypothetical protein